MAMQTTGVKRKFDSAKKGEEAVTPISASSLKELEEAANRASIENEAKSTSIVPDEDVVESTVGVGVGVSALLAGMTQPHEDLSMNANGHTETSMSDLVEPDSLSLAAKRSDFKDTVSKLPHASLAKNNGAYQHGHAELENAPFSLVDEDDSLVEDLSGPYTQEMQTICYIGTSDTLLRLAISLEAQYKVTLPLAAYGLNCAVFEDLAEEVDDHYVVTITSDEDEDERIYELVTLHNSSGESTIYFSCMSHMLDSSYIQGIIADATTALYERKEFVFKLVGLRLLDAEAGKSGCFIETMRLNSFELSAVCKYMKRFTNVKSHIATVDGVESLIFVMSDE